MEGPVLRKVNEELVDRYLQLVAADDYRDFGALITDDCQFALMPTVVTSPTRRRR
jgi:ketosteroid isomerase-like protein